MEEKIKCTLEEHKEINAIIYCPECRIYMCNKCEFYHKPLFKNHHPYNINTEDNIFTGFCKEKNHPNKLDYFCKNHNQLCCGLCIAKLNERGEGQHKDCDVCYIENIKEEKKNKLKENIKCLENLENTFNESMESLKKVFEKIEKDKENLKGEIQNIFTKIRNALNNREDVLLSEIDKFFRTKYFNEDIIKKGEKLPKQISLSLKKGKLIDKEWDNNNLNSYINDCINIENNIKNINIINESLNKCNINKSIKLIFSPKDKQLEKFIETIKWFGKIIYNDFSHGEYPINKKENLIENDTLINVNITMLCDYPFQEDKINHSISNKFNPYFSFGKDKASLTVFKGLKCINTNGLLAVKRNINLNRDWILQFEFCKKDWSPRDWNHIFSFGTHINFGGEDNSYYAITLETEPRDGYQIMRLTSKNAGDGKWHKITIRYEKETKLLNGLVDNISIETKKVSLGTTSGFYFGGKGGCGEFSMYLRNFKFFLDLNLINFEDFISLIDLNNN